MQTLLQFAITQHLGPPERDDGDGEAYFACPICGSERFHTMPAHPKYKDRFKCWSCNYRGDLHDWLAELYPDENYRDRLNRIDGLREEFQKAQRQSGEQPVLCRGHRGDDPRDIALAWSSVVEELGRDGVTQETALKVFKLAAAECRANNISIESLFDYWLDGEKWIAESNERHMEECDNPECDYYCCRLARGWSEEQVTAAIERARRKRLKPNGQKVGR